MRVWDPVASTPTTTKTDEWFELDWSLASMRACPGHASEMPTLPQTTWLFCVAAIQMTLVTMTMTVTTVMQTHLSWRWCCCRHCHLQTFPPDDHRPLHTFVWWVTFCVSAVWTSDNAIPCHESPIVTQTNASSPLLLLPDELEDAKHRPPYHYCHHRLRPCVCLAIGLACVTLCWCFAVLWRVCWNFLLSATTVKKLPVKFIY